MGNIESKKDHKERQNKKSSYFDGLNSDTESSLETASEDGKKHVSFAEKLENVREEANLGNDRKWVRTREKITEKTKSVNSDIKSIALKTGHIKPIRLEINGEPVGKGKRKWPLSAQGLIQDLGEAGTKPLDRYIDKMLRRYEEETNKAIYR